MILKSILFILIFIITKKIIIKIFSVKLRKEIQK